MTYIRVVDDKTKLKVDLNANHIVAFAQAMEDGEVVRGTLISLTTGGVYHVSDTPRSVRGYLLKATGQVTPVEEPGDQPDLP